MRPSTIRASSNSFAHVSGGACLLACLCLALGCQNHSSSTSTRSSGPPESISFEVDGTGVQYFYRDGRSGTRSTRQVESIPLHHRGAVQVYAPEQMPDGSQVGGTGPIVYTARLFEARPGETREAERLSRATYVAHSLAGELAHHRAIRVEVVAREMAKMDEDSRRRDTSSKARNLFETMLPRNSDARKRLERNERARQQAENILKRRRDNTQ